MKNRDRESVSENKIVILSDIEINNALRRLRFSELRLLAIAFLKKVMVMEDRGCWIIRDDWSQYTTFYHEKAHILSYRLFVDNIIRGRMICHHCDRKGCINFGHLFQATQTENKNDWINKRKAYLSARHQDMLLLRDTTGNMQDPNKVIKSWWEIGSGTDGPATSHFENSMKKEDDGSIRIDEDDVDESEDYEEED